MIYIATILVTVSIYLVIDKIFNKKENDMSLWDDENDYPWWNGKI